MGINRNKLLEWKNIIARIVNNNLQDERDTFFWLLKNNGSFIVNFMYKYLLVNTHIIVSQKIWRFKILLEFFLWSGVILTKDNLARRNWSGNKSCVFCCRDETTRHLFFDCAYAKFLWRAVYLVLGLRPPTNILDLFHRWYKQGPNQTIPCY